MFEVEGHAPEANEWSHLAYQNTSYLRTILTGVNWVAKHHRALRFKSDGYKLVTIKWGHDNKPAITFTWEGWQLFLKAVSLYNRARSARRGSND